MFRKLLSLLFVFSLITFIVSAFAKDFGSIIQKTDTALYASEFQVIHDSGELSSAVTSYTISGLDGDVDEEYELIIRHIGGAATSHLYLRPNNDSGSNYGYQYIYGESATAAAFRETAMTGMYLDITANTTNYVNMSKTVLYAKSGYVRTAITQTTDKITGTTVNTVGITGHSWNNTSDNIKSLVIFSTVTNGIGVGSRFILLARRSSGSQTSTVWQLVERKEVTGSAITSYTFNNLDGNTDVLYKFIYRIRNGAGVATSYGLKANDDETANYGSQRLAGDSTTVSAYRSVHSYFHLDNGINISANNLAFGKALIYAKSGYIRTAILEENLEVTGTTVTQMVLVGQSWNNTTDNITSLVISAAQTNGLGVGTVMELWALKLGSSSGTTPTPTPTPTPTDTTAPSGSVSINSGASYTNSTTVTLTLSATDSVGVVGYYVSTSSSTPVASASGWNSATSTTSYSGSVSYTLASGDGSKTIYVWYKDFGGNVSSSASDSITLDTTAPIVTITSPTSDPYTSTSSTVSLEGSSSDTTSGVKEVTWSSDKGSSGTASGTNYWSISSVSLSTGDNKITVTAKDNAGNTSTDTITVTYSAAIKPTVLTGSATNVTATSATLTGTVNANGLSTTAWFEYGTVKGTYGNKTTSQTVTGSNDTTVSITITGLTAETTYYYRIAAQNNSGTSHGEEMSFQYSSKGSAPTVTTDAATDVTTTTATLNGTVNANGISTTAWFEYGAISGSYGSKSNTKSVTGSTDTKVSIGISGLTSGTTYYFRVVAQNSAGTSYGKEMSFYYSTEKKSPTVETESATDVTTTSAKLNGKVNPNGLSTTAWFEYGTVQGTYNYQTDTQSLSGSTYTNVSATITGLTAGTKYYYRIVAKNSAGTSYGTEMEFYKSPGTDTTPTPTITAIPTPPPIPTQTGTPTGGAGAIYGYVKDAGGNALQGVEVSIFGSGYSDNAETNNIGYYAFENLAAGSYTLTYKEDGYETQTRSVSLGEGEAKDLGTVILEEESGETTGSIYGYVVDIKGEPIESVRLRLKGLRTKVIATETSDADGYFEFAGLGEDTYVLTAKKKRYRNNKQKVTLGDGESKEIEIEMRKTTKKIKGLFLMEDDR